MKKVLMLLMFGAMVLTANTVLADAKLASQQGDARLIDNVDLIFGGYANKVVQYQNVLDYRLNDAFGGWGNGSGEWGGLIDGKHQDLGVIGVYVNRPFTDDTSVFNNEPSNWTGVGNFVFDNLGNRLDWDDAAGRGALNTIGAGGLPARGNLSGRRALTPTNNLVDIFYGKANDNGNFGIHVNYAEATDGGHFDDNDIVADDDPAPNLDKKTREQSSRVIGADIALGILNAGAFNEVNLHAGYYLGMTNNKVLDAATGAVRVVNDLVKDDGIYSITLGALAQKDLDNDNSMRLFVDAALDQNKIKGSFISDDTNNGAHNEANDEDYQQVVDNSGLSVALGLGCNHKVNDGAAVVSSGLVGNFATVTRKYTVTTQHGTATTVTNIDLGTDQQDMTNIQLFWNGSVDAKIASWLRARAGIRTSIFSRNTIKVTDRYNYVANAPTNTFTEESSTNSTGGTRFSVGFGANFENFTVDTNVMASTFESSIAGVQPGRGLLFSSGNIVTVAQADVKYNF